MQERESIMLFGAVPRVHWLASRGCQKVNLGRIFLSVPHTHEKFLYYTCTTSRLSYP